MQERVQNAEAAEFKVIGTRPIRPDGVDKVTGRARFGADYNLPGQLIGKSCAARIRTRASSASTPQRPKSCRA